MTPLQEQVQKLARKGLKHAEIAEQLGRSREYVTATLHRLQRRPSKANEDLYSRIYTQAYIRALRAGANRIEAAARGRFAWKQHKKS